MIFLRKQWWLDLAEAIDALRIVPRAFLAAVFSWTVYITAELLTWYMSLSHDQRSVEASGFAAIVWLGVMALMQKVYSTYADGGRDWTKGPP